MGIAGDIKDVLAELGSLVEVHPPGLLSSTPALEYFDSEGYIDQSTIFTRMFMLRGTIAAESTAVMGSILKLQNNYHLVTHVLPSEFENEVIELGIVLFLCNVVGTFARFSDVPAYDEDYKRVEPWTPYAVNARMCLCDNTLFENVAVNEQNLTERNYNYACYVSDVFDVQEADRLISADGTKYNVKSVNNFSYPGLKTLGLSLDDRG